MNKKEFLKNSNKILEQSANKILEDYAQGKNFHELIKLPLVKSWRKVIFIEYKMIIFIIFIRKLMKNKELHKKFNTEIMDAKKFYNSIENCEYYIYLLFTEIEKINLKNL